MYATAATIRIARPITGQMGICFFTRRLPGARTAVMAKLTPGTAGSSDAVANSS